MKPLGIAQQGLWAGYLLNEDRAMFNTAECIAFAGKVRSAELIGAVQRAVAECEALSGVFVTDQEAVFFARSPRRVASADTMRYWRKNRNGRPRGLPRRLAPTGWNSSRGCPSR